MKLSIIIPVYNEKKTILKVLDLIEKQVELEKQIIVVNDCSTDNSFELVNQYNFSSDYLLLNHSQNLGKGACIKTAKQYIKGEIIIIQDTSLIRIFVNHMLTILSNLLNNQNLTDAHTCYKVCTKSVFDKIELIENDFAFCPEFTSKVSNLNEKIYEIPIQYLGRTYEEGKKISSIDGIKAISALIKYALFHSK